MQQRPACIGAVRETFSVLKRPVRGRPGVADPACGPTVSHQPRWPTDGLALRLPRFARRPGPRARRRVNRRRTSVDELRRVAFRQTQRCTVNPSDDLVSHFCLAGAGFGSQICAVFWSSLFVSLALQLLDGFRRRTLFILCRTRQCQHIRRSFPRPCRCVVRPAPVEIVRKGPADGFFIYMTYLFRYASDNENWPATMTSTIIALVFLTVLAGYVRMSNRHYDTRRLAEHEPDAPVMRWDETPPQIFI